MDYSAGNKYNNLKILKEKGFQVPDFRKIDFIDFPEIVSEFLDRDTSWDKMRLWQADASQLFQLRDAFSKILEGKLSRERIDTLVSDLDSEYFAVRSSFFSPDVQEDSISESFAGIGESFLFVHRDQLEEHVLQAYLSLFTEKAIEYFRNRNYDPFDFNVSVFIQTMVRCSRSFIVFTREFYQNTSCSILISSTYGMCEGLVKGKAEADTFIVSRENFRLLSKEIAEKKQYFDLDDAGRSFLSKPVRKDLQLLPSLTESDIIPVSRLSMQIEALFDEPQDIEGGIDESGRIWFFQTRPVTVVKTSFSRNEDSLILDCSNITESYPGVTTPLTFYFARDAYANIFRNAARKLGLSPSLIEENSVLFDHLISFNNSKIYYMVSNWYKLFRLIPGAKYYTRVWDQMIGIKHSNKENSSLRLPLFSSLKILLTMKFRFQQHSINCKLFYLKTQELISSYRKELNQNLSAVHAFELLQESGHKFYDQFSVTILNDFFLMISTKILLSLLKFKYKTKHLEVYGNILNSLDSTCSHKYIEALGEIASDIRKSFKDTESEISFRAIIAEPELKKKIEGFIQEFGTRHEGELKLEVPSLKDKPEKIFSILKPLLKKDSFSRSESKPFKIPKRHLLLYLFSKVTLFLVKEREDMRFVRSKVYHLGRSFYLKIGQQFKDSRLINEIEDIFFLTPEEIKGLIYGYFLPSPALINSTIIGRKMELERNRAKTHYRRFQIHSLKAFPDIPNTTNMKVFKGTVAVPGHSKAPALRLKEVMQEIPDHYILLAKELEPGNIRFLLNASGIVTEHGSIISHSAIVARQFNIPFITNVNDITAIVKDGQIIEINTEGEVRICDEQVLPADGPKADH